MFQTNDKDLAASLVKSAQQVMAEIIHAGARMHEVEMLMTEYLHNTRHIGIFNNQGVYQVYKFEVTGMSPMLFDSSSYTACLQFALKQPLIEVKESSSE